MSLPRGIVQVAGIRDEAEARSVSALRPHAIGLPYLLCGRPEDLDASGFERVVAAIPKTILTIWITYLEKFSELEPVLRHFSTPGLQLHGHADVETLIRLRKAFPTLVILKSLIVGKVAWAELEEEVARFTPHVDGFLTDTWEPSTGKSGATGKTHDWTISRRLVALSQKPMLLAGGLTPENVEEAITAVKPWGVDSHTGLETGRAKDPAKVSRFLANAARAFASLRVGLP